MLNPNLPVPPGQADLFDLFRVIGCTSGQASLQERKMTWGQVWLSLDLGEVPASPEVQTSMPEYTNEDEDEDDEDENR